MKYRVIVFYNEMIMMGKEFDEDELEKVRKLFEDVNKIDSFRLDTDDNKSWYFSKDIVQKMIICVEQIDDSRIETIA